ncbi:unnamed protein product, partial [Iphiclides podalirius]
MPPSLQSLLITLYVYGHVAGDEFRPTPIPLDEWRPDERRGRAGTLHETINTDSPAAVFAVPAHYWEDALRHSVYLTLVRDKIDQLIARGDIAAPNGKPHPYGPNEVDDQDLWDKIKAAPFERLKEEELTTYGDVTILARGRLMEQPGGFRFTEDDKSKEKCNSDDCMEGVKAFWSVKRVRQRDQEITPGRYHYELTFSVMSQIPRRQKKPHEHPIRTFTVQENDNKAFEPPQTYQGAEVPQHQGSRPGRAIWFHKNIQTPQYRKKQHQSGLERLFSSWFDDYDDEPSYEPPKRYKQTSYHPSPSQYSKVGHVGGASSEQHSQKTLPYPYRPYGGQYQSHPSPLATPPMAPIQQHYIEPDTGGFENPYVPQTDYKVSGLNNTPRTTRPAVLPTPLPPLTSPSKEFYNKQGNSVQHEVFEHVTNPPENAQVQKQYNKVKTPTKVHPYPDQLRPPIYNAPPGVFVTRDKKPFKPMPPMKIPIAKPLRTNKPIDFRPSPQVLDVQFSEPDPLFDTAFRPITVNYFDSNTTENFPVAENNEKGENKTRKPNVTAKKPLKKHEMKSQRITTTTIPDIITLNDNPEQDDMEWADILGIFSKTTPMESHKDRTRISQTTTPLPTSSVSVISTSRQATTEIPSTPSPSTVKPKKRTRPPPKFTKTEKIKKHKRITTTTTTTTSPITTTTDTPLTTNSAEERKRNLKQELTQQASNSVIATTKPKWLPSSKTSTTTPFSTTTTGYSTTTTKITTTTKGMEKEPDSSTARPKNVNRFRQSTLMLKGTSVKHDRWTVTSSTPEKHRGQSVPSSLTQRRKGSNFHGYVSSTAKTLDEVRNIQHIDHGTSTLSTSPKSEESTVKNIELTSTVTPAYEETNETSMDSMEELDFSEEKNQESSEESRDHTEYIFPQSSDTGNNKNMEISDSQDTLTTENIVSTTSHPLGKTKKCKKKHQNLTTKESSTKTYEIKDFTTTNAPSTTPLTTPNILEDLLNDFSFDDNTSESETTSQKLDLENEQSQTNKQYFGVNDELEELLDSLKNDNKYEDISDDEYEEEDEGENEDDGDDDDDGDKDDETEHTFEEDDTTFHSVNDSPRYSQTDYEDNEKRPFTLLELMAME